MKKHEFDHVIAAAASVTGEPEIVVIGSQAILGTIEDPPQELAQSMEADVYPRLNPEKTIEIDAMLGDGSSFQDLNGFYAHGVGPETVVAPDGWEERLVAVEIPPRLSETKPAVALCLEIKDLMLAKSAAGRPRDWEYVGHALEAGIVRIDELLPLVDELPAAVDHDHVREMLTGAARRAGLH